MIEQKIRSTVQMTFPIESEERLKEEIPIYHGKP
jgi:hypothetical protein